MGTKKQTATPAVGAAAPPGPKVVTAADLLGGMAKAKGTGSKKSDKPAFHDPSLDAAIEAYIENRKIEDTAKALAGAAKDQILSSAGPARLRECVQAGMVVPSIEVNGKLTLTQMNRYSAVPEDRSEAIQKAFGAEFNRFFQATLGISLKQSSANNEAVLAELVAALGEAFIGAHFDIRRDLLVQDAFHNDYSTRVAVQKTAKPFMDDQTIRPYSPSLKVK